MRENLHPVEPEELMAYLEGELSLDQAARAAEHLQKCCECQELASELKHISESLTTWDIEFIDTEIRPGIAGALDEREQRTPGKSLGVLQSWRFRRFAPWLGGAFAGGVAVLLLVFAIVANLGRREHESTVAVRRNEVSQQVAEPLAAPAVGERDRLPAPMASAAPQSSDAEALARRRQYADLASNLEVDHSSSSAVKVEPIILRTAQLTLVAQNFDTARSEMDRILQRYQGYLGDLNVYSPSDGPRKLTATLRVPASQMDAALTELKTLGRVESESQNGQDVTAQYVDLEARLINARNTEQRLTDLLRQRTGKLSDVLEVETELSRVRGEIEQMEAERRLLSKQVSFATLTATITEVFKAQAQLVPNSLGTRFRNAAIDGYQSVVNFVIDFALFLVSYGPSFLLWVAILFFPARFAWRKYRSQ